MAEPAQNIPQGPRHVAFIMDGNGRWAKKRGLPRTAGHKAGAKAFREIVKHCLDRKIRYLTVYAFSTENWNRPKEEVDALIAEGKQYVVRFKIEPNEEVHVHDIIRGEVIVNSSVLTSKVTRTSNGVICFTIKKGQKIVSATEFVDDGSEERKEIFSRYRKTKVPSTGTTITNVKQLSFLN